jgi:hypothetical protein
MCDPTLPEACTLGLVGCKRHEKMACTYADDGDIADVGGGHGCVVEVYCIRWRWMDGKFVEVLFDVFWRAV